MPGILKPTTPVPPRTGPRPSVTPTGRGGRVTGTQVRGPERPSNPVPEQSPRNPPRLPPSSESRPPTTTRPAPQPPRAAAPQPRTPTPPRPGVAPEVEAPVAGEVEAGAGEVAAETAGETAAAAAGLSVGVAAGIITGGALLAIGAIAGGVAAAFIGDDNKTREAYTQNFVATASQKFPNCNVVICHTQHRFAGPQVVHQHHEIGMKVGTCGYDSYCSPKGQPFIFENQGDGGYLNWAYAGEFSRNGNTLTAKTG